MVCPEIVEIDPCTGEEIPDIDPCTADLHVCGVVYNDVNEAWKATNIAPHRLRYMASSNAFEHVYWV